MDIDSRLCFKSKISKESILEVTPERVVEFVETQHLRSNLENGKNYFYIQTHVFK